MADGTKIIGVCITPEHKELLLVKNNGVWDFPGGFMRPEENDVDCLVRVITEEQLPYCTLKINDNIGLFFIGDYRECDRVIAYCVDINSNLAVGDGLEEAKKFALEDLFNIKGMHQMTKTVDQMVAKLIGKGLL